VHLHGLPFMSRRVSLSLSTGIPLTPLSDHSQGFSLKTLRHLVLDEADRLLNMDFEQEIDQILKSVPRERRTQLFSATMTSKARIFLRGTVPTLIRSAVSFRHQA